MFPRVAVGREQVVREVRAAGPLLATLRAPVPARGPWLTAVLNEGAARLPRARPVAVVVAPRPEGRPEAAAFLALRRSGLGTTVTLLGEAMTPVPGGMPPFRLPAQDDDAAAALADAVVAFLDSLRGPWLLRLTGLPLGDPTLRALAVRLPTSMQANRRSSRLVDDLDAVGSVARSRDPRVLERWLPALLERAPDPLSRRFLRATARLHAAIGQVEVAVIADGDALRTGLLTLVDGTTRTPWWGTSDLGGLRSEPGHPLVGLTAPSRGWPRAPERGGPVSGRRSGRR